MTPTPYNIARKAACPHCAMDIPMLTGIFKLGQRFYHDVADKTINPTCTAPSPGEFEQQQSDQIDDITEQLECSRIEARSAQDANATHRTIIAQQEEHIVRQSGHILKLAGMLNAAIRVVRGLDAPPSYVDDWAEEVKSSMAYVITGTLSPGADTARIEELEAELEVARKDTERLDWMFRTGNHVGRCANGWVAFFSTSPRGDPCGTQRAAIDSAIAYESAKEPA